MATYKMLVNNMPILYMQEELVTDKNGNPIELIYRNVNSEFEKHFYRKEEVIGRKGSEIFPESKFSALFFACRGQFACFETLLELLAASEQKPEKRAPQQRVVHIPLPRFGVAVEDV